MLTSTTVPVLIFYASNVKIKTCKNCAITEYIACIAWLTSKLKAVTRFTSSAYLCNIGTVSADTVRYIKIAAIDSQRQNTIISCRETTKNVSQSTLSSSTAL